MRRRASLAAACLALCVAAPPGAQELVQLPPPVLTLDQERLFNESRVAEQVSAEIERQTEELAAENRRIEAELVAEELELTEQRPGMEPEAFRALADAFDAKVERIRAEQDAKARELQRLRERQRQDFLRRITPILADIVRERGAVLVIDRRSALLSADQIDITDEAIRRINAGGDVPEPPPPDAANGDGSPGLVVEPAPETPAPPPD